MALWALWNSNTFSTALQKAVNLLGDADTVASQAVGHGRRSEALGWGLLKGPNGRSCWNIRGAQVGAIVGQMAGALYGWKQILADEWSHRCVTLSQAFPFVP